ncbi:CPD photolyase isoform X2 [Carcharodon carcharias]|uniref:CPD photolyase isoform X1 n=1 Tax=Carcharodon carcharias TaxID=13397 RepID=UPI001B7F4F79|nr:CPD photolyase isoform X1 [Carcharodon carcharias]XP_041029268.1 CPD photolyase isoform X2 [Carcharodon carcharias]
MNLSRLFSITCQSFCHRHSVICFFRLSFRVWVQSAKQRSNMLKNRKQANREPGCDAEGSDYSKKIEESSKKMATTFSGSSNSVNTSKKESRKELNQNDSNQKEALNLRAKEKRKVKEITPGLNEGELSNPSNGKKRKVEQQTKAAPSRGGDLSESIKKSRLSTATSVEEFNYNKKRVRLLSKTKGIRDNCQGIIYWMSRDQRVQDNWAFLYAQWLALKHKLPLHVCFCLVPKFHDATIRHFDFMLKGLQEVAEECKQLDISFHLLIGFAKDVLPEFVKENNIGSVVTDFSPLRSPLQWVENVRHNLPEDLQFVQVDAHNIVPCWVASEKQEYSARTIRRKIHDKLPQFLTDFPPVVQHPYTSPLKSQLIDWDAAYAKLQVDLKVKEVDWAKPGTAAGLTRMESFIEEQLKYFSTDRNNPNKTALSNMSPWFHFGQISVQRAILEIRKYRNKFKDSVDSYIEEAVVRRELADNFCFYNKQYDKIEGASDWAQKTLKIHSKDQRSHLYTLKQLEDGKTHDPLWNAAQLQMVLEGKMHGFLRMYWAKKILEWTTSPEEALQFSIYLNDRYQLDGKDPNGYVGCMWSICGIHDQGWAERPVFGKIRYMNYNGCKKKFDVGQFERKYNHKKLTKPL